MANFRRAAFRIIAAAALAAPAYAQAAVEYALKSSGSALSGDASGAGILGCRVDSTLPECLIRHYPKGALVAACLAALLAIRWLARVRAVR
jgi:hypothetical protein